MEKFQVIAGDITTPKGFQACGIHIGIKKKNKDLALIVSDVIAEGAALFTTNKACAAPVKLSKKNVEDGKIQAFLINSGNANACTGNKGYEDAKKMIQTAAEGLGIPFNNFLLASTGVIGLPLPMDTVLKGINKAVKSLSYDGGQDAAEAILTTDTKAKKIAVTLEINGKKITIAGIAKGSGMIHPNMATMLAFITTDAKVDGRFLKNLLKSTVDKTYNMITVDGDTSTNDTVAVMANGMAGNIALEENHPEVHVFKEAFYYVNEYLAKSIVQDGEGATKFLEVEVQNSKTFDDGKKAVMSILNSNLVKTAFFGEDGNWGRIMCSLGYSGGDFQMDQVTIFIGNEEKMLKIVEKGQGTDYKEEEIEEILKHRNLKVLVDLHAGHEKAKGWGCDLSYEYVKINGAYRS